MYSSGGAHGDTAELQQYIEPLLHKYNVQVGSVSRHEVWHATDMSQSTDHADYHCCSQRHMHPKVHGSIEFA